MEDSFDSEIIALKSIYEDELRIHDSEGIIEIHITIYPATADDESSRYVCLDLVINVPDTYPSVSPKFDIPRSRGLSDEYLLDLKTKLLTLIEQRKGDCILFDILDLVKENITDNNIPSDICSICLCGFDPGVGFLKTKCYHYFHKYCMRNYMDHSFNESVDGLLSLIQDTNSQSTSRSVISVLCPVCKTPNDVDVESIRDAVAPENEEATVDLEYFKKQRQKFDSIYQSQKEKGGIIDLEYEKNKFLLSNIQRNYDIQRAAKKVEKSSCSGESSSQKQQIDTSKKNSEATKVNHSQGGKLPGKRQYYNHGYHRNSSIGGGHYSRHHHYHHQRAGKPADSMDKPGTGCKKSTKTKFSESHQTFCSKSHGRSKAKDDVDRTVRNDSVINKRHPNGGLQNLKRKDVRQSGAEPL